MTIDLSKKTLQCWKKFYNIERVDIAQCGFWDFSITQILREINFVESRSSKMLLFAILGALSFVNLENFSLQKVKNFMKFKMNSL